MALTPRTRLGPYEITAQLGVGGMGEVYRAMDTKLGRQVAIKVLPASVAQDGERLARFDREARTLATLNHPNIAAIYGLEDTDGTKALVMELVEGPTLADRIAQGAIPVEEALPIAKQIAEALEAAHEQAIIHRDLKPANIKVRPDGTVKVLDFGLAKAMEPAGAMAASASMAPTITTPAMPFDWRSGQPEHGRGLTQAGMILGTAAYMSPEQARGKTVDKRADIWAFGCVLYEMLTGRRAFAGDDVSITMASVLMKEPDWAALPGGLSSSLVTYLRRCLQKDARHRVQSMGDVRLALEGVFETAAPQPPASAAASATRERLVWMVAFAIAAVLSIALAIPTVRHLREVPSPRPPETRTEISTPATDQPGMFALSPDGRQIVFVASGDGASRLWVRPLGATTAQPLAGTDGATSPFWSPDGRSVGFFAGGALRRLDLGGGAPQTLAPATSGRGGTWSADGVIVFAPFQTSPLLRVSATGGPVTPLTTLGPQQYGHIRPFFLPDGRRFLFAVLGVPAVQGIYLSSLDGSAPTRLTPADQAGVYLPSGPGGADASREGGWLLWVREGSQTLVAQRLDAANAALTGEQVPVADGVAAESWGAAVSVAASRLVAYRAVGNAHRQLTWVDRSGAAHGSVGDPDATFTLPRVSPDGRRVAVSARVQGNVDVWLLDGTRKSRVTFDPAVDDAPLWSPDGTRIVFRSRRTGQLDLFQRLTSGAGVEEPLVVSDQSKIATSWSADGRFVLYFSNDLQTNADLWVMPMVGDPTPSVVLKTPAREAYGAFSPDGRWVAYHSNESGRNEIFVRPFILPGASVAAAGAGAGQWQVSTAGGIHPLWRPDGKELYYLNPAGEMMAAPMTVVGDGLEPGAPGVLFPTRILGGGVDTQIGRQYDVARDGRFLINTELPGAAVPITLIQHWNPEAQK